MRRRRAVGRPVVGWSTRDNVAPSSAQPVLRRCSRRCSRCSCSSPRAGARRRWSGSRGPRTPAARARRLAAGRRGAGRGLPPSGGPLLLISGDGDFGLLASDTPVRCWSSAARPAAAARRRPSSTRPSKACAHPDMAAGAVDAALPPSDGSAAAAGAAAADVVLEQQAADGEQDAQHADDHQPDLEEREAECRPPWRHRRCRSASSCPG